MRKFFLVVTLLSLSASTGAIAQQQKQQQQRSGTPEEQKACAHDVQKFCRAIMDESDLTILACLQQNRPKLTRACDQVLVSNGQ
jgi:ATP-dependent Zn protease